MPSLPPLPKPSPRVLRRAFSYLRPHWKLTAGAYLMMLLIDIFAMLNPQLIRWAIDHGIEAGNTSRLALAVAALLLIVLVKGLFTYFEGLWTEVASQNVAYDIRNELQRKITLLSFSYHDQAEAGDLLSRTIQDVERIRFLTGRASFRIIEGAFLLLITAVMLVWMNPRLGLLSIAAMPLLVVQSVRFGRHYRPLSMLIQKQLGVLTTRLEQNLRGVRVVKTFAQEAAEIDRFEAENDHWFNLSAQAARLQSFNIPILQLITNLSSVVILLYGGSLVIQGGLTLGELVAFTTYMGQLISPVRFLGMILPALAMAGASAERVFEVLDRLLDVTDLPGAQPIQVTQGRVTFENVSFSYSKEVMKSLSRSVLKDVSFEALPNQVIALLGPTGSGKTSIVNLIPRFYDPTDGRITIDGQDIRLVTVSSLRAQIGIVLQETTLFAASVRENILFGRPEATQADVENAARMAQAEEFILHMPQGYDTQVGERGITLSGGQKQRLAIARALLTDPRILILDDATSSVDSQTEHLIQLALEKVMQNRTTFVIAHRLSTVQRADQILVLDHGSLLARGTHAELLTTSPLYRSIYEQQLKPKAGKK